MLQDDFDGPGFANGSADQAFTYSTTPQDPQVQVSQQNGSLVMFFPAECLDGKNINNCILQLDSKVLDASAIQYMGLRARTPARTFLRGVSVSLSVNLPSTNGNGFGWFFTDRALAFFHSIQALPEKNLYAAIPIDLGWHAYEILRDPQKATYSYYIDGQLVETYTPVHASAWNQAPLQLSIYSIGNKYAFPPGQALADTQFEIDQVVVGAFKSR